VLQSTRTRRRRIPPFHRRELPSIYLAVLVFGLVVPLLPPLRETTRPAPPPTAETEIPAAPPPVQVELAAPAPVEPRAALLNKLADSHTVALTFDDGPDPRWSPRILAILKRHGAVATFCMVSRNVGAPAPMRGPGAVPGLFALESAMMKVTTRHCRSCGSGALG